LAITTINILARWCRRITVEITPTATSLLTSTKGTSFRQLIEEQVNSSDPYNDFSFASVSESAHDRILVIGSVNRSFAHPQVYVNAAGWIAGVRLGKEPLVLPLSRGRNPVGPGFAACIAAAELFRSACGIPTPGAYTNWYSLLEHSGFDDFPSLDRNFSTSNPNLGRVYQIGCGAVGSSLDFFLSLSDLEAHIHLVDYDKSTVTDCNRSMAITADDAFNETPKVTVCKRVLASSKATPHDFSGDYAAFIQSGQYLVNPPDVILCLANERNIWETIQQNLPPAVLHATTTVNWGLNFGRHLPKQEWCLLCRFGNEVKPQFTPPCSQGIIPAKESNEKQILGALPFLSPAAALLVLADLIKLSARINLDHNFVQYSMRSHASTFVKMTRQPDPNCICQDQPLITYPEVIKKTKYWPLADESVSFKP
jgi:hypothetical protein